MPYLARSAWGAAPPVKTIPVSKHLKGVCLHWMGFPVRTEDPVRLVKSIQRGHMAQDGTVLEGRGLLYRSGAQGSTSHNRAYVALGLLLGDGDHPTDEMIEAVRERISVVRFFQSQATKIVGHSELKPTTCPGTHVRALIRSGAFEPDPSRTPPPPPAPPTSAPTLADLAARVTALEQLIRRS